MSHKSQKIATLLRPIDGGTLDPHYYGFFDCFNRQLFFEAHEVLEHVWLPQRGKPLGLFYKGLIQLAGAFVHIQKGRRQPALALLKLARQNLEQYPPIYQSLDIEKVLHLIGGWTEQLQSVAVTEMAAARFVWPVLALQEL